MKNVSKTLFFLIFVLSLNFWVGCATTSDPSLNKIGLANPAAVHCIDKGGQLKIEKDGSGAEYGVCVFEDNRQCEEWALLRGRCSIGGIKVTGYLTDAAKYCAIRGGQYNVTNQKSQFIAEQGTCILQGGRVCDAQKWFSGSC